MRILLVLKRPAIAGVETLAMRMANTLIEQYGDQVGIVFFVKLNSESFFRGLNSKCEVYSLSSPFSYSKLKKQKWDIIYSFESFGLLFSFWFWWRLRLRPLVCTGVYHPREYQWSPTRRSWTMNFITRLLRLIPDRNLIFMNDSVQRRTSQRLGSPMRNSSVIPLPINTHALSRTNRNPERGLIVSVGRLTDFKTYNEHIIRTVAKLVQTGHDVCYRIYGGGELRGELEALALDLKVGDRVFFEGEIAYEKLPDVFTTAHCFVGCGTALLEASAAGVPSLTAIEAIREPMTFGFFSEASGYNLGEANHLLPQFSYLDLIQKLLQLDDSEYLQLSQKHQRRVSEFDANTVVGHYRHVFQSAQPLPKKYLTSLTFTRWIASYFLLKIFDRIGFKNILTGRYLEVK